MVVITQMMVILKLSLNIFLINNLHLNFIVLGILINIVFAFLFKAEKVFLSCISNWHQTCQPRTWWKNWKRRTPRSRNWKTFSRERYRINCFLPLFYFVLFYLFALHNLLNFSEKKAKAKLQLKEWHGCWWGRQLGLCTLNGVTGGWTAEGKGFTFRGW